MAVLNQYCWTFPGYKLYFCQQPLNIAAQMRRLILSLSSGLVLVDHQGHNLVNDCLKVKSLSLNSQLCWWSLRDVKLRAEKSGWKNKMILTYSTSLSYSIVCIHHLNKLDCSVSFHYFYKNILRYIMPSSGLIGKHRWMNALASIPAL